MHAIIIYDTLACLLAWQFSIVLIINDYPKKASKFNPNSKKNLSW